MKRLFLLPLVLVLAAMPVQVQGRSAQHPRWSVTIQHLDYATMRHVVRTERHSYPLLRSTSRPIGHTTRVIHQSPHIVEKVSWPLFEQPRPAGYQTVLSVSAYAPGCGASGATASGVMPYVGVAAGTFAFNTHISVPGFGVVSVLDRGVGPGYLDLYMTSCAAAVSFGRRLLTVTVY